MSEVTIYGASDDLMEFEGAISEEFYVYSGPTEALLKAPSGDCLMVSAEFGNNGWDIRVGGSELHGYPSWPIRFTERPDREGDPAVVIDVPEGTKVFLLTKERD